MSSADPAPVARVRVPGLPDNAALAERLGASVLELTVTAVDDLTPSMVRVDLEGPALVGLEHQAGQDVMLRFPTAAGGVTRRRYTIRRLDPVAGTMELDIVRHGDGPAARWAASAAPGMTLDGIGPRGKVTLDPEATTHVLIGDETFIPAAFAMAEAAPASSSVLVVLEAESVADELPTPATAAPTRLTWVHRGGEEPGTGTVLAAAVRALDLPPSGAAAYLGGEQRVVADLRRHLVERGVEDAKVAAKSYWRRGVANADHGEPARV